ncbi:MAG: his Kinase domain protein [Rickettsiaceae bacterium]|nr:his Kinase domain protein [Rickettsiaceae bacterium]
MFSLLPAIVACYFLFVGFFVIKQNKNSPLAKVFFALCLTTFMWQFIWAILFQVKNEIVGFYLAKLGWVFILFLPTTLYHFLAILSGRNDELKRVYYSYALSFLLALFLIFSDLFISGIYIYFWGFYPKAGSLHPIHVLQTTTVVLRGLYITYKKQVEINTYRIKSQLRYCMVGLLIYLFAAVDYLCNYGIEFYPPGIIFITISLTIITYAIVRHKLLDLSLVISLIFSRTIVYSTCLVIFVLLNFAFTGNYLPSSKIHLFVSSAILILCCEAYNFFKKQKFLEDKAESLRALAGSIAHELRNPLNAINLAQNQIEESLSDLIDADKETGDLNPIFNKRNSLLSLTSTISNSVTQANNIINMILSDLTEKPLSPSDFSYLKTKDSLEKIIAEYSYNGKEEKAQVKLDIKEENNFTFKAIPDRFTFIIYNLLKNALYYLKEYPSSTITIGTEVREVDGKQHNIIYIHDTGPGIAPHIIPKLFGDFYTSGKKEGTGLGLAFCKRNMKLFGGDIICESELGKWTKFSLLFPILSEEEVEKAKSDIKKKKILLVDEREVNLITTKSKIEKFLPDISCDIITNGKEAVRMVRQDKYDLILMDVQMPEINGIEVAKRIKNHDKKTPIIALTSLNKESFLQEANQLSNSNSFNHYLDKTVPDNILFRTLTKWMIGMEDDLSYIGTKEEYLKVLKDKKLLLADDERINLIMTKKILEAACP